MCYQLKGATVYLSMLYIFTHKNTIRLITYNLFHCQKKKQASGKKFHQFGTINDNVWLTKN